MSIFATLGHSLWTMRQFHGARRSPQWVHARQERRLRELVKFAAVSSPFYRGRFKNFDVERCSLTDLPVTNKGELMANFDRVVTDPDIRRSDLERFVEDSANIGRLFHGK